MKTGTLSQTIVIDLRPPEPDHNAHILEWTWHREHAAMNSFGCFSEWIKTMRDRYLKEKPE
jgi:hypothetical protein